MLAQRACDSTPSVRSCLADVVGDWLLDLPDRYVFIYTLLCIYVLQQCRTTFPEHGGGGGGWGGREHDVSK